MTADEIITYLREPSNQHKMTLHMCNIIADIIQQKQEETEQLKKQIEFEQKQYLILKSACDYFSNELSQLRKQQEWIPVSERLPTMDEFRQNDGRFIVTDGQRVYQALFDIYTNKAFCNFHSKLAELLVDNRPIAWMPLPKPHESEIIDDE